MATKSFGSFLDAMKTAGDADLAEEHGPGGSHFDGGGGHAEHGRSDHQAAAREGDVQVWLALGLTGGDLVSDTRDCHASTTDLSIAVSARNDGPPPFH